MAKVLGVGGIFFKSPDPAALMAWYQKALGMPEGEYIPFLPSAFPPGGATVFSPFKADTEYFKPSTREFMFNLMVDDLDGVLAMVREAGGQVVGESDHQPYGSFNWIIDPDGNKIELWQPKEMPEG
jgi:predicted enzyme related to lactoylglutathione lyase